MEIVISNASTTEDEEPLYDIKKVDVLIDNNRKLNDPKSKVKPPIKKQTYHKSCYVPLCPNSTRATPDKMFITVPVNPLRRKQWLDVVGKNTEGKNPKSPMFCCQDHFNLENDMNNYEDYLRRGKMQMILRKDAVPHVFLCNQFGHLTRKERLSVLRRLEGSSPSTFEETCEPPQRKTERTKKRKSEESKILPSKAIFIEVPSYEFEYQDEPEYVEIKEDAVETIVIEDSDYDDY